MKGLQSLSGLTRCSQLLDYLESVSVLSKKQIKFEDGKNTWELSLQKAY